VDSFAGQGIQFFVGVILARLLDPSAFGLIGMLAIFIAISQSIIDSGFGNALIRKKDCSNEDFSTVFYFNIIVSFFLYGLLYISAPYIAKFYNQPLLILLLRVLGLGIILNAFGLIQRVIFTKNVNFKAQTQVSFVASILSGLTAVYFAYSGYGVWALVILTLTRFGLISLFFWIKSSWRPVAVFSKLSFFEMFGFGSKLLLSGLLHTVFVNLNQLVIGKFFSPEILGYYSKAEEFKNLPSQNLNNVISRVSFPMLARLQDDQQELFNSYVLIIRNTMFISFLFLLGLSAIAENLILLLLGQSWIKSAVYLQLLCFIGMLYPLHSLNLNMLKVKGRSDLFLRLEVIKKFMAIPILVFGVLFGIEILIIGAFINSCISFYLNSFWSGRLIGYTWKAQLNDVFPSFYFAIVVSVPVFVLGKFLISSPLIGLSVQIICALILLVIQGELKANKEYLYFKREFLALMKK